jgi:phosphoenolpyruvate carboxykinase (ATP)
LTHEQAAYYFLSGYTALVGSTEVGQTEAIKTTFSTCFGAPFFPRPAKVYANLLIKRLKNSHAKVYLVNTGWTGGTYGGQGRRFSIPETRAVIKAILNKELNTTDFEVLPGFNLVIPTQLSGINNKLLNPKKIWNNPAEYDQNANELISKFINNFNQFEINQSIRDAGPVIYN